MESVSDASVFARPPVMAAEWNRALHLTAAVALCVRSLAKIPKINIINYKRTHRNIYRDTERKRGREGERETYLKNSLSFLYHLTEFNV